MAWIHLLTLGLLMGLAVAETPAAERQRPEGQGAPPSRSCDFDEDARVYSIEDLLLCMNDLAAMIILQQDAHLSRIRNRVDEEPRPSPDPPEQPKLLDGASLSTNYIADAISSLLTGALPLPSLPNSWGFMGSFTRPGLSLFAALTAIARYDNLRCIPRILCEVASGSTPGVGYGRGSGPLNLGQNGLFWLLTALDGSAGGTSPVLIFGRAALIGYANRGRPESCYREYPRCPRNPEQLILYLNNYNGGFFRLFSSHNDNHYRPSQSAYYPYGKSSDSRDKDVQWSAGHASPQVYLGAETDAGTEAAKLALDNAKHNDEVRGQQDTSTPPTKTRISESNKIVFPTDEPESDLQFNPFVKSTNILDYLSVDGGEEESLRGDRHSSHEEENGEHGNAKYLEQINKHEQPYLESLEYENSNPYLPDDNFPKDASTFTFPSN